MIENDLSNKEVVWRVKNVKPVEKQKIPHYSSETQQQKMVEVSVKTVNSKEMQGIGKRIEILSESLQKDIEMITKKSLMQEAESYTEQTKKGYSQTKDSISTRENSVPLKHTDENVSVVEKQTESSSLSTILIDDEGNTESLLSEGTYTRSLKKNDTQKNDTDYCV